MADEKCTADYCGGDGGVVGVAYSLGTTTRGLVRIVYRMKIFIRSVFSSKYVSKNK